MIEHKIIIPSCDVVLVVDGEIQNRVLTEDEQLVDIANYHDVVSAYVGIPTWNEETELFEASGEIKPEIHQPVSDVQKLWDAIDYLISSEYVV